MRVVALLLAFSAPIMAAEKWKLSWSDEFDYAGLPDSKRWTNEVGFIRNREEQYYTAGRKENARVENGRLIIEARKEKFQIGRASCRERGTTYGERILL